MKRKEAARRLAMVWESRTDKEGTVYEPLNPERLADLLKELGLLKELPSLVHDRASRAE